MKQKSQDDVGADFDSYAQKWRRSDYQLEVKDAEGSLLGRVEHDEVQRPGDEWGLQDDLVKIYRALVERLAPQTFSVMEIGSGAGRLTEVLCGLYADRLKTYRTLDVSAGMTDVLKSRLAATNVPITHTIGGSEKIASFEPDAFDLVISQSCWSHINFYDQYLYLRDIRRAVRYDGYLVVNGIFLLGGQSDWTWNRFIRRVSQKERSLEGVYHEFAGSAMITEMALRLGWQVVVLTPQAIILRFKHQNRDIMFNSFKDVPESRRSIAVANDLASFLIKKKSINRKIDFLG